MKSEQSLMLCLNKWQEQTSKRIDDQPISCMHTNSRWVTTSSEKIVYINEGVLSNHMIHIEGDIYWSILIQNRFCRGNIWNFRLFLPCRFFQAVIYSHWLQYLLWRALYRILRLVWERIVTTEFSYLTSKDFCWRAFLTKISFESWKERIDCIRLGLV